MKRFLFGLLVALPVCALAADKKNISMVTYFPVPYVAYSTVNVDNNMDIGLGSAAKLGLGNEDLAETVSPLDVSGFINVKGGSLTLNAGNSSFPRVDATNVFLGNDTGEAKLTFNRNLRANTINALGFDSIQTEVKTLKLFGYTFPNCKEKDPARTGKMYWTELSLTDKASDKALFLTCGEYAEQTPEKTCYDWYNELKGTSNTLFKICKALKKTYSNSKSKTSNTAEGCCVPCSSGSLWNDYYGEAGGCAHGWYAEKDDSYGTIYKVTPDSSYAGGWNYSAGTSISAESEIYLTATGINGMSDYGTGFSVGCSTWLDCWKARGYYCSLQFNNPSVITLEECPSDVDEMCSGFSASAYVNKRCLKKVNSGEVIFWDVVVTSGGMPSINEDGVNKNYVHCGHSAYSDGDIVGGEHAEIPWDGGSSSGAYSCGGAGPFDYTPSPTTESFVCYYDTWDHTDGLRGGSMGWNRHGPYTSTLTTYLPPKVEIAGTVYKCALY